MKEEEKPKEKRVYDTGEEFLNKNSEESLKKNPEGFLNSPVIKAIDQDSVIQKAEANFLEDDELEPFLDREYAEETKRIYDLLKNKASMGDFESPQDRAIFDIVEDIFLGVEKQLNKTQGGKE